jgi:hypothetical protein
MGPRCRERVNAVTTFRLQRILCDNPECVLYVDELEREEPDEFELVEHVRSLSVEVAWTRTDNGDFCPVHRID